MNLPAEFIANIQNTFGEEGKVFLANLPALIGEAAQRWGLSEINPVENLSYNFVAYAFRASTALPVGRSASQENTGTSQREEVVLKIGVPDRELRSEIAALRLFNGEGAVRLLEADESRCMFLLERVNPGMMLSTLGDDEQATHIAADVMLKLWQPVNLESDGLPSETKEHTLTGTRVPGLQNLIKLSDWFEGFNRLRALYGGGTGPLDKKLIAKAEGIVRNFFAEDYTPTLIHGDFHHYNILSSTRGCTAGVMPAALRSGGTKPPGWLVIDPKGVIGPAAYEVGPFLLNPWVEPLNESRFKVQTKKRIDILSERLGFERERIRNWGFAHAVLSAFWSIEDQGDPSYAIRCAELLL